MQLFAYSMLGEITSAQRADRGQDYRCLECSGIVRLRGGIHRQKHFFHLTPTQHCSQRGKGMVHLQVQRTLERLLPEGECLLECRFPEVGRIADAVWEREKVVFEVQCAGMSAEEAQARMRDYRSLGYQVVWILHDSKYNRWRMTAFEEALAGSPHYFTSINANGDGQIYDQWQWVAGGIRRSRLWRLPVDLRQLLLVEKREGLHLIRYRSSTWQIHFVGDLLAQQDDAEYLLRAQEKEALFQQDNKQYVLWKRMWYHVARSYRIIFYYFLERACH